MMIAQQLYEGINLEEGPVGLITYMRTDSVRISDAAREEAENFIRENYSEKYLPDKPNIFKNKKGSQDAHEAVRPTSVSRTPDVVKPSISRDQFKLYRLIWEQFVTSQMADARLLNKTVDITADGGLFRAYGQSVVFDGFLKALRPKDKIEKKMLPDLSVGEKMVPERLKKEVHFTEPPPRFSDASIVKFLEESGIGRPSTYAPIITTLIRRYYIERENKQFVPTFLGKLTNKLLIEHFQELIDVDFTSAMESKLDKIAEGNLDWEDLLNEFYPPFMKTVETARDKLESYKGITDEETDYDCEKCGRKMVKRLGKYGYFLACPGFPDCRNTKSLPLGKCPREGCDGDVVARKTRRNRKFYGCSNFPECDFMTWDKPTGTECPKCGSITVEKSVEGERYIVCLNEQCGHKMPAEQKGKKKDEPVTVQ
jgi:DNA topoisomerase-1